MTAAICDLRLGRPYFDRMLDAREADLSDELPADIAALEDYADGTSAELMRLALDVLGTGDPQAEVAAPTLTLPRKRGRELEPASLIEL